jgi:hypothetical protein
MTIMTEMTPSPTPALDYDSTLIMTVEISDENGWWRPRCQG